MFVCEEGVEQTEAGDSWSNAFNRRVVDCVTVSWVWYDTHRARAGAVLAKLCEKRYGIDVPQILVLAE